MKARRLFRITAVCDWMIALFAGIPAASTLYVIRTGQFRNWNWLDPASWARTQEWGLLLCLVCVVAGLGLWTSKAWSRWLELLLAAPKAYCGFIEFQVYAMTRSWPFLVIALVILGSVGMTVLLWVFTDS
jgi:hypothetical protein